MSLGAQLAVPEDDEVSIVDEVAGPSVSKVGPLDAISLRLSNNVFFGHIQLSSGMSLSIRSHTRLVYIYGDSGKIQDTEHKIPWPRQKRASLQVSQVSNQPFNL